MDKLNNFDSDDTTPEKPKKSSASTEMKPIKLPPNISVRQLAETLNVSVVDIIKQLMKNGIMVNINQVIDYDAASLVAVAFSYKVLPKPQVTRKTASVISEIKKYQLLSEEKSNLKPRPPVITIMGHVDHGKTRLLDAIRQSNVMDSEAGGITQHIGAYQVEVSGQKITFLDTPGHEAFTAMRARGSRVTDVTVLVVAADDGVKPQTLEAIDHAKAANVPIVVAINKIDKPDANPETVKQQLADAGLVIEEWGGDTISVQTSAKAKKGIDDLLENLLLVAEMENLLADPHQPAKGVVIEAEMDKTKGPLATILVHDGTLKPGDSVVVGTTWGRIRAMYNDTGKQVKKAKPSMPVVILGLHAVPQVGDTLSAVSDERKARELAERKKNIDEKTPKAVSLYNIFDQISSGRVKELNIVIKADVQGSIEPIKNSLQKLSTDKVQVKLIHTGIGNVTESDIMLAIASKGLVIVFNAGVETGAKRLAETEGIDIRNYNIIYELVDDVEKALKGLLEPEYKEVIVGRAEVRALFPSRKKRSVAGVYITEGKVSRGTPVRVLRNSKIAIESVVDNLRRFKDDVKEVTNGYECGIIIKDYDDFQVGDILEFFSRQAAD
ncbi:MAG: translation initiation factor IF-2 [Dehalococcoidia bacterium]|nr:MAG: translation initiation factor IF-2 [Dehalococcoidia bacterium]